MKNLRLHLSIVLFMLLFANLLPAVDVTIGAGDEQARIPFNFYYFYSLYETLYYPAEVNSIGLITAVTYYYNFNDIVALTQRVQIWMGETTQSDLSAGWIPSSQLTMVFDGNVTFNVGQDSLIITLDTPFPSSWQNLVIMTKRPWEGDWISNSPVFQCQTVGTNRALNFYSDTINPDPANPPTNGTTLTGQFPKTTLTFPSTMNAALSGTVTDNFNLPVSAATVQVDGMGMSNTTNHLGQYFLPIMLPGTYQVTASKDGYASQTQPATFVEDITTFLNFTLSRNTTVTVTGRIVNSFLPSEGVPNTAINVAGVANIVTDDEGYFTVPNVPADTTIAYSVYKMGFEPYSSTFETTNTDLYLGFILLNEIHTPPLDVMAVANQPIFFISWTAPIRALIGYKVWRLDVGEENNPASWTLLTPNVITATNFVDTSPHPPGVGTWSIKWAVKAVYSGNQYSPPAFSNAIIGGLWAGIMTGIVTSSLNGLPVQNAQVNALSGGGNNISDNTDEQGIYSIIAPPGSWSLTVSADGFVEYEQSGIQVTDGDTTIVDIALNPTSNPDEPEVIAATGLTGCYPNPFNVNVNIRYEVKEPISVSIEIYNLKGQKICTLVNASVKAGRHALVWNGTDTHGRQVSNGVYYCKMQAGSYSGFRKLILLK